MSNTKHKSCICEKVLGVRSDVCDSSVSYVCEYLDIDYRSFSFQRNGHSVDEITARNSIVDIIGQARYPLVAGYDCIGIKSQQQIVNFARSMNAVLDPSLGDQRKNENFALAREGMVTASFGEAISRSDLVLLFGDELKPRQEQLVQAILQNANMPNVVFAGNNPKPPSDWQTTPTLLLSGEWNLEEFLLAFEGNCERYSDSRFTVRPTGSNNQQKPHKRITIRCATNFQLQLRYCN